MNDLIVDVKLWGESVGSLYWEKESNAALFDYERKFIRSGLDISPIIMPISQYRNKIGRASCRERVYVLV